MSRLKTLALVPALVLAMPQAVAAAPAPLAQVQAHLQAVDTMTASFTQTDRRGEIRNGTLILKKPGRIRFEYQGGPRMLLVGDGKQIYFIDYTVNQKTRLPIANSPYSVLLSANPDLSRIARVIRDDPQTIVVEARDPKKPQFGTITLGFAKGAGPAGLTLEGWTIVDAQNNRTTIRLSNPRFNVAVADSAFRFEDPRGRGPKG
ncbi:MAG TPA: outer-membrane lipoprotein carrier protein LolA [Allosphingosinicella sp.]|jgi:outer membrane lipoprotein-sorting protein|nr:outer-membrane lipoprotein carrier protein LolA [Allosphingosinicella sp.]